MPRERLSPATREQLGHTATRRAGPPLRSGGSRRQRARLRRALRRRRGCFLTRSTTALLQTHFYRNLVIILFAVWAAQIATTFGTMFGVVQVTRSSLVPTGSSTLTTTDGLTAIATASLSIYQTLSSVLPDEAFQKMTVFQVSNNATGSLLSLSVLGFARIMSTGSYGSVIRIITAAGTVTLDGRAMFFAESVAPSFAEAGFSVSTSRRRLLDLGVDIAGFFGYLAQFDLDALESRFRGVALGSTGGSNTTFASFPTSLQA